MHDLPFTNNYKWKTKDYQIFEENKQNKKAQNEVTEQMSQKKIRDNDEKEKF